MGEKIALFGCLPEILLGWSFVQLQMTGCSGFNSWIQGIDINICITRDLYKFCDWLFLVDVWQRRMEQGSWILIRFIVSCKTWSPAGVPFLFHGLAGQFCHHIYEIGCVSVVVSDKVCHWMLHHAFQCCQLLCWCGVPGYWGVL